MSQSRLAKIQFLVFNGKDPQLWRSCCKNYFKMYGVEFSLWVLVAAMHLEGPAANWLQSAEHRLKHAGSMEVCQQEKIKRSCSNLEKRVDYVNWWAEERFASLEMAHVETEAERAVMNKQFGDLKLEVSCLNRFLE
jgi:hypothetical protein